jgi:hypothetical protein
MKNMCRIFLNNFIKKKIYEKICLKVQKSSKNIHEKMFKSFLKDVKLVKSCRKIIDISF